ncbi:MAG: ABC transporter permease [Anaerolineae bacterium]|nr:ABC transporter permease [Anaerolineae bacterium]
MKLYYQLAYRNLMRHRRRSLLSMLALGAGLALLLLMSAVVEGEMQGSLEASIRLQSGHVQVYAPSYHPDRPSLAWEDLIADPMALAQQIAALPGVQSATPRLFASGILARGDESIGVSILGIDPPAPVNDPFRKGMLSGAFLQPDDRDGVLVGKPLAEKLNLAENSRIYLLINTSSGEIAEGEFTVRGIYSTGIPGYDKSVILMPLDKAQAIAQANNHATAIFVLLKSNRHTSSVAAALRQMPYQVKTYEELNALTMQMEQFSNAYMYVLYLIILAITASVIVNTLVMAVFERTREIGILAALGMRARSIMALFLAESSLLAAGGILMGLVLGAVLVAYAALVGFHIGDIGASGGSGLLLGERIYAAFDPLDSLRLIVLSFIITLLAGIYPAALAARMQPVDALRRGQ